MTINPDPRWNRQQDEGVTPSGPGLRPFGAQPQDASQAKPLVPNADARSLSAWPERRPPRTESERSAIAERFASHLPKLATKPAVPNADLDAMRAAFIRRFDEQLPRTETLMAVAHIGYRMAVRDLAKATPTRSAETTKIEAPSETSGAVPKADAQTPSP